MILRRLPVRYGRWSAEQVTRFGAALPSVAYLAVGPFCVLFALPERLRKPDAVKSIFDLNKHLRERAEASAQLFED